MQAYDPNVAPTLNQWLSADDEEKVSAVVSYHLQVGIPMANDRLHAAIHVVVENQLALGERVVMGTLARLMEEGLTRHDAIHAVGSVLVNHLAAALRAPTDKASLASSYLSDLTHLTAQEWLGIPQ